MDDGGAAAGGLDYGLIDLLLIIAAECCCGVLCCVKELFGDGRLGKDA